MGIRDINRRQLLVRAAATAASLSLAVSITAASRKAQAKVQPTPNPEDDNEILNVLLNAEYDAIATYTAGAGIIDNDTDTPEPTRALVTDVALHFQDQHKAHAAALKKLIEDNDGTPVDDPEAPTLPDSFPAATATTTDVLKLAADKEKQAAVAYATVMKSISTQTAAKLVAAIGAVETQHFVVLYLLVEGLIEANENTAASPTLVVPAAFVLDVGANGTTNLEDFPALDELLSSTRRERRKQGGRHGTRTGESNDEEPRRAHLSRGIERRGREGRDPVRTEARASSGARVGRARRGRCALQRSCRRVRR
jgi:rubrerythrin